MNPPKCDDLDDIHFLIAAQKFFTCTEAARCQPEGEKAPAHDAFTKLLSRKPFVDLRKGLLILDDTTLDKPYARKMDLVTYHWSGKHQRVVKGIALLTLLWTDGFVRVFRTVSKDGGAEHWANNDLEMTEGKRKEIERKGWGIEVYR